MLLEMKKKITIILYQLNFEAKFKPRNSISFIHSMY